VACDSGRQLKRHRPSQPDKFRHALPQFDGGETGSAGSAIMAVAGHILSVARSYSRRKALRFSALLTWSRRGQTLAAVLTCELHTVNQKRKTPP